MAGTLCCSPLGSRRARQLTPPYYAGSTATGAETLGLRASARPKLPALRPCAPPITGLAALYADVQEFERHPRIAAMISQRREARAMAWKNLTNFGRCRLAAVTLPAVDIETMRPSCSTIGDPPDDHVITDEFGRRFTPRAIGTRSMMRRALIRRVRRCHPPSNIAPAGFLRAGSSWQRGLRHRDGFSMTTADERKRQDDECQRGAWRPTRLQAVFGIVLAAAVIAVLAAVMRRGRRDARF
jgi:hypothetical protein